MVLGCCSKNRDCVPSSGLLHFASDRQRKVCGLCRLFAPWCLST